MSRKIIPLPSEFREETKRLNLGCGRHYHSDWVNLDLQSDDPNVICHDVTQGIPFEDGEFDSVYHSHILEHLDPIQGQELVAECFRVLKPNGILRIVVPNLEEIAKLYLAMHDQAWRGIEQATVNYHWMKMEMLDQMVRSKSGGLMGPYMAVIEEAEASFVRGRLGSEFNICRGHDADASDEKTAKPILKRLALGFRQLRVAITKRLVRTLMGTEGQKSFEESLFRGQGEIHRWMYDRYSLRELCQESGFVHFRVTTATESGIQSYADFELDSVEGKVRKPDSLFVECQKPGLARRATA